MRASRTRAGASVGPATGAGGDPALKALLEAYHEAARSPGSKKSNLIDAFIATIEKGYFQPGDRLANERELAAVLPVSLGTVQSAFRRLVDAGVVERKAGVGTHITNLGEHGGDKWFLRFLADEEEPFLATDVLGAEVDAITASGPWASFIGARPSYVRIRRLISVGGEFGVVATVFLDGVRFRPLLDFDLAVVRRLHIRQILHDRFGSPTLSRRTRVRFHVIDGRDARDLDVAHGTQGLALDVSSSTLRDEPMCFQRFVVPPNRYALDIRVKGSGERS